MKRRIARISFAIAAVCAMGSAWAASAPAEAASVPPMAPAQVGAQLSALYAQLAVKTVQAEIAKKDAEIAGAKKPLGGTNAGGLGYVGAPAWQGGVPNRTMRRGPGTNDDETMVVQLVSGVNGHLSAQLLVGGHVVEAHVGDTLPGGWTVLSITVSQVTVSHGGTVRRLGV
ncbi:MAG: type IV pilus biogenesis protein PilP [Burkholderiales bacterium]|nr:type IV pilus biogenesis protein PilP [Burkholderiales bacterium]